MAELDYLAACVLGLVQGLTEFLPISSSGHLVLVQHLFDLDGNSPELLLFDIATHVATVVAVAVVFRTTILHYLVRLVCELRPGYAGRRTACMVSGLGVAACIPTAAIGLGFRDFFERAFDSLLAPGIGLMVTGALLFAAGRVPRPRRGWRRIGAWRAAAVGVAQGCAILPGVSRSGATICTGLFLGIKRRWAAEFSFFIAMPPIIGAGVLQWRETAGSPHAVPIHWGPIIAGSIMAFLSGAYALRLLLLIVVRDKIHHFCYYCWAVGIAVLCGTAWR